MIGAIVLAAGRSQRMGSQKLLLPLRGKPVIAHVVNQVLRSPVNEIVVVVGRHAAPIKTVLASASERGVHAASPQELVGGKERIPGGEVLAQTKRAEARAPVRFIANPDPDADMLSSVRCGLRALPLDCEAVLVVLGDQPGVSSELIASLTHKFQNPHAGIVVPQHRGRRGHPLLFAARFGAEVLTRHDGVGLKGLLAAHPREICEVEVADAGELADLDTPQDYESWQNRRAT